MIILQDKGLLLRNSAESPAVEIYWIDPGCRYTRIDGDSDLPPRVVPPSELEPE